MPITDVEGFPGMVEIEIDHWPCQSCGKDWKVITRSEQNDPARVGPERVITLEATDAH